MAPPEVSAATSVPVDTWVAFCETTAGGSAAGIVHDGSGLADDEMQSIALAVGAPATCFIQDVGPSHVDVRFFSTLTEYGMCGHGSVALLTALIEAGTVECDTEVRRLDLVTPTSRAVMSARRRTDGRPEVMLSLDPAPVRPTAIAGADLADALGASTHVFSAVPMEESPSDFVHLIVPMTGLDALASLAPDFAALTELCETHGVHTVAAYSPVAGDPANTVRVRDFCPATGTNEAPATGTTNRAVSGHLARHDVRGLGADGSHTVRAEQGIEMGRPSLITTSLEVTDGAVTSIAVGGVATFLRRVGAAGLPRPDETTG